jgi:lysophospholipase L1-like esterase
VASDVSETNYLLDVRKNLQKKWPGNRTVNLVFHGHSVPAGYFQTPVVDTLHAYPHLVLEALKAGYPFAVVNAINTSIGGENSEQGARRFQHEVLTHRPDVLFIDYALNDRGIGLPRARAAWQQMIDAALAAKVKIVLLTPTPDQGVKILDDNSPLAQHARQIRELAAKNKVARVDSYAAFVEIAKKGGEIKTYMSQINHPNEKGHRDVVELIMRWFAADGK